MPDILTSVKNFLRVRPRSAYEVKEYLKRKQYHAADIENLLERLMKEGCIDDRKFAKLWIDDRLTRHPRSKHLIIKELIDKGLEEDLIEGVFSCDFSDYDEYGEICRLGEGRLKKISATGTDKTKQSLYVYLLRLGFDEELVNMFVEENVQ